MAKHADIASQRDRRAASKRTGQVCGHGAGDGLVPHLQTTMGERLGVASGMGGCVTCK